MSLKTVLVHLADDDHHRVRLDVALRMAKAHNARLTALFITYPVGMPAAIVGRGASAAYLRQAVESARTKAKALEEEFHAACRKNEIAGHWVVEDGDHLERLAYHAHVADVAIVSSPPEDEYLEDRFHLRFVEEFVFVSGAPVLVLPRIPEVPSFGNHVMVAWHATREAVRAVRDAMPLLEKAARVSVVSIGATPEEKISEREVVDYLSRRGVNAEPVQVPDADDVGLELLAVAAARNCDMIVMGAYGHSRALEMLLGGVTRHVFRHATLPVLMTH